MEDISLVVLAAGMGSRYGGLKQLDSMDAYEQTLLDYSVYDAYRSGFKEVIFIIRESFLKEFEEKIGNRMSNKITVKYAFQDNNNNPIKLEINRDKPLGTGHALYCAMNQINNPFMVVNADDFYGRNAFRSIARNLTSLNDKNRGVLVAYPLINTLTDTGSVSRGICTVTDNRLIEIVENTNIYKTGEILVSETLSANTELDPETLVSMNCWGFSRQFLNMIEKDFVEFLYDEYPLNEEKAEFYLPTVVNNNIKNSLNIQVEKSIDQWFGVTYQEDKERVMNKLKTLRREGVYPEKLWEE